MEKTYDALFADLRLELQLAFTQSLDDKKRMAELEVERDAARKAAAAWKRCSHGCSTYKRERAIACGEAAALRSAFLNYIAWNGPAADHHPDDCDVPKGCKYCLADRMTNEALATGAGEDLLVRLRLAEARAKRVEELEAVLLRVREALAFYCYGDDDGSRARAVLAEMASGFNACKLIPYSSRMCELGTKCCVVVHNEPAGKNAST